MPDDIRAEIHAVASNALWLLLACGAGLVIVVCVWSGVTP
jgi:hypothetical protein